MSDDVSMKALSGTIAERSRAAFVAGCDVVLHCNGDLGEMAAVAVDSAGAGGRGGAHAPRRRWRSARRRKTSTSMPRANFSRRWWTPDSPAVATEDRFMTPEDFDTTLEADRGTTEPAMIVDVEGFEGPLDLLLALARTQKVDLAKISILALADQYLHLHRGGAATAAGTRRRLSGDGGLARLSQIAPAAAGSRPPARGRAPRTWRWRWRIACAGWRPSAKWRPADGPAAAQPRRLRARPARADRRDQAAGMDGDALRPAQRLCAAAQPNSVLSRVRFKKRTVWSLAEARAALERMIGMSTDWSRIDAYPDFLRGGAGAGGDRVGILVCLRARTGARRDCRDSSERVRSRRSTCASGSA